MKKRRLLVAIGIAAIVLSVFQYWLTGGFLQPQGTILMTAMDQRDLPLRQYSGVLALEIMKIYKVSYNGLLVKTKI